MSRRWRAVAVAAGLGALALTAAACGGSGSPSSSSTTVSTVPPSTVPPSTVPPSTPTTGGATSTTAAGTTTCPSSALHVHVLSTPAGTGHEGVVIGFTNQGGTPCTLTGYPGVALLNSAGAQAAQATRTTSGYLGGLRRGEPIPLVSLAPGATASATVEGTDVPTGTQTSCPTYPGLLVTPPNLRQSVQLKASVAGCSPVEVHPVVPGTTGSTSS